MKPDSIIYLVSFAPLFNADCVPIFESFSKENSQLLYQALIENHREIVSQQPVISPAVFCFDNSDKDLMPLSFLSENTSSFFAGTCEKHNYIKLLAEKYSNKYSNNLIIFSNSIGISSGDISKIFNLLAMEDETIVIGKSSNSRIAFLGFNSFNKELFMDIDWNNLNYESLLQIVNKHENFIHVMNNFMLIENLADFKQLYAELSKKESLSYCSQQMHEKFTHLFIEYKELLK